MSSAPPLSCTTLLPPHQINTVNNRPDASIYPCIETFGHQVRTQLQNPTSYHITALRETQLKQFLSSSQGVPVQVHSAPAQHYRPMNVQQTDPLLSNTMSSSPHKAAMSHAPVQFHGPASVPVKSESPTMMITDSADDVSDIEGGADDVSDIEGGAEWTFTAHPSSSITFLALPLLTHNDAISRSPWGRWEGLHH